MSQYQEFLAQKSQVGVAEGFDPTDLPGHLFDFQRSLVEWAVRKGRAGIFADCGLGKTPIQLAWSEQMVRRTNRPVLILTPLAVGAQTIREAEKFGVEAKRAGTEGSAKIVVANYQRLHHFEPSDFSGVVCDESSILKNFDGATKAAVTEFLRTIPHRLLYTATAAPNDVVELGTSSEALGQLGYMDMLHRFFRNDQNTVDTKRHWVNHGGGSQRWRFKGHAERPFWQWVCSWARALRRPSDLGFDDGRFILPELIERDHVVGSKEPRPGYLFALEAHGLTEQRQERKHTERERCEKAAALVAGTGQPAVCWANTNAEGDLIESLVSDAIQISGADSDEAKEEKFEAFAAGQARVLVVKPVIGAWGLNWQHCAHMTTFASYSFEQYYQGVRRCWRFGQARPVVVDNVASDGEGEVLASRKRKAAAAEKMFGEMVGHMVRELGVDVGSYGTQPEEVPSWL